MDSSEFSHRVISSGSASVWLGAEWRFADEEITSLPSRFAEQMIFCGVQSSIICFYIPFCGSVGRY